MYEWNAWQGQSLRERTEHGHSAAGCEAEYRGLRESEGHLCSMADLRPSPGYFRIPQNIRPTWKKNLAWP